MNKFSWLVALFSFLTAFLFSVPSFSSIDGAKYPIYAIQTVYSSTNVGSTYVALVSSSSQKINAIQVTDSGGQTMQLGFGSDCSHISATMIIPKNSTAIYYPVGFPKTWAICIKSLGTTVSSGENDLNVFF